MKNILSLLLFLITTTILSGQMPTMGVNRPTITKFKAYDVNVYMKDGTKYFGTFKISKSTSKTFTLKPESGKKLKLNGADVDYIDVLWSDQTLKMIYGNYNKYIPLSKKIKFIKRSKWLIRWDYTDKIEFYVDTNFKHVHSYFLKKKEEEIPFLVNQAEKGAILQKNFIFKRYGVVYFKDCKSMIEKINNKDIKGDNEKNMRQVLLEYDKCK